MINKMINKKIIFIKMITLTCILVFSFMIIVYAKKTNATSDKSNTVAETKKSSGDSNKKGAVGTQTKTDTKAFKGIKPIFLGLSQKELTVKLKQLDPKFSGFKGTKRNEVFQVIKKIKGKKMASPLAEIVDDKVYYKKVTEFLLTPSAPKKKEKNSVTQPKPIELRFALNKIHPKIKSTDLHFFNKKLYEIRFIVSVDINEMNELIEAYHKKLGEESTYQPMAESYSWSSNEYKVLLIVSGYTFPRDIHIQFSHLPILAKVWDYFGEVNEQLKKLLNKDQSRNMNGL